jgi:prepilin-type N-terminal cleavage/methylation domain-containing protein
MMTSATGKSRRVRIHPLRWNRAGFTLVELLSVVAIMAIVMAALGYAVSNMGGPAPQVAAAQVASGLSLARQYAVAKNLETRFLICNLDGSSGSGLPPESWRYWSIIQTNRGTGKWTMLKVPIFVAARDQPRLGFVIGGELQNFVVGEWRETAGLRERLAHQ